MATVAVVITKIHNVTHWCTLFNCLSRKQASKIYSSLRPERLGFKMSLLKLKSSAGHFRKPVRKSANCGLKVLVCRVENRFLTANICRFAVKNWNQPQINNITRIVSAISKKYVFTIQCIDDLGGCISKVQHPLIKFLCCGTIISQRCCYSYSKMSWLKVRKIPTARFCAGKLRLFEVAKGCTRRLWWHAQHV